MNDPGFAPPVARYEHLMELLLAFHSPGDGKQPTLARIHYGNGAIVADLAGPAHVMRGRDYDLLDLSEVQARLAQPPDLQTTHPEKEPVEPSLTALASGFISFSAGKKVPRPLKDTSWCLQAPASS